MLGEDRLDLFRCGELPGDRILETAIDAGELLRRGVIDTGLQLGLDLGGEFGEFFLSALRPRVGTAKDAC